MTLDDLNAGARAAGETVTPQRAQLAGGDGPDTLTGGAGDDSLSGGAGDDVLSGGAGSNFLDGGLGVDTVSYAAASAGVTASLATNSGRGGADTLFGFENLVGSGYADHLTGNALDNTLTGGAGQDSLAGGEGADLFVFGLGHTSPAAPDVILDWSAEDRLTFVTASLGPYQETSAPDAGRTYAESLIAAGARYVAVETPAGVILYVDTAGNGGAAEDAVLLSGRTLADVSAASVGSIETLPTAPMGPPEPSPPPPVTPAPPAPNPPALPAAPALPSPLATTHGQVRGDMDTARLANLLGVPIEAATSTHLRLDAGAGPAGPILDLIGTGFFYDANGQLRGGTVREIIYVDNGGEFAAQLFVTGVSAAPFLDWVLSNATQTAFATILAGHDRFGGSVGADLLRGYGGNDHIGGNGGGDTIFGGQGDDQIFALFADPGLNVSTGPTYLRGDEGDDYIVGADGFDDINGNMGNDTASGGAGDDWVVGGKEHDLLFGASGHDLVYGNLGSDTCSGGAGNDIVRGGQENDHVFGDGGDDYVSGDKGDDTVTGGAGADLFHTFGEAGIDRVTDFSIADGDRVFLDPGTQYAVAQSGADTVISMTGGGQMVLVGVQMSALPAGWIFGA